MKRKEITETIAKVGAATFSVNGCMSVIDKKTGTSIEVDVPGTLTVVRGALFWFEKLIEDGAEFEPDGLKNLQSLLGCIGSSIAYSAESDEDE